MNNMNIVAFFLSLTLCVPAQAVTIEEHAVKQTPLSGCSLTISGTIVSGDAQKIETVIASSTSKIFNYPSHKMDEQYIVCLSGAGGNYLEGIKIARVLSKSDVTTKVEDNTSCLSACAIAFMGGRLNSRSGEGFSSSRYLYPGSVVGFHAPQLIISDGNYTKDAVLGAYKIALDAISEIQKSAKDLYLDKFLITEMFAHRGQDFYYISTVDDLAYFDIGLLGSTKRTIRDDNRKAACWNAFNWNFIDSNERFSTDRWNKIFQNRSNNISIKNLKVIYEFYPFDGSIYCHVSEPSTAPLIGPVKVVLSSWEDLSEPLETIYTTPLILMRGNRLLKETR